jgi:3-oxoacyl-[acyl-carrier-protein] synthase II
MTRVVITGAGVISSAGQSIDEFWENCLRGVSLAQDIPEHWLHYYQPRSKVWAPLPSCDYAKFGITRTERILLSTPALIGLCASYQATQNAGLETDSAGKIAKLGTETRMSVHIGTGLGAAHSPFDNYATHLISGLKPKLLELQATYPDDPLVRDLLAGLKAQPRVNPLVICQTMPNALAANISLRLGVRGAVETSCAACASGTVAIGKAFRAIKAGETDIAIAGGVEHLGDRTGSVFMGFDRLQTLASPYQGLGTENRPFDQNRSGFLFSEGGAAILVLESLDSAVKRGQASQILAEVVGFGQTSDAHSIAAISADNNAIRGMLDRALGDACVKPADIDYINAHGTGTEINDRVESGFISQTFPQRPLVNSTKSILGHTIGAAGAFEAITTAMSLHRQMVHPSRNLRDPIADLNFPLSAVPADLRLALTHNFGFGGHNAGLVLQRYEV